MNLKSYIKAVPNFPKQGIVFRDITPLLLSPQAFAQAIEEMAQEWKGKAHMIAGLDARGFIFGTALAMKLELPFLMIRKKGKLPGKTEAISYGLEYGKDTIEICTESLPENRSDLKVLVVDDLLATGGTAQAACTLIEKVGMQVAGCAFAIELSDLPGRNILKNYKVASLLTY